MWSLVPKWNNLETDTFCNWVFYFDGEMLPNSAAWVLYLVVRWCHWVLHLTVSLSRLALQREPFKKNFPLNYSTEDECRHCGCQRCFRQCRLWGLWTVKPWEEEETILEANFVIWCCSRSEWSSPYFVYQKHKEVRNWSAGKGLLQLKLGETGRVLSRVEGSGELREMKGEGESTKTNCSEMPQW